RPGMARHHQAGLVAGRRFRLRRAIHQIARRSREAQTLWRLAPADHECRRIPTGQSFAIRNCDALFSNISHGISFEETASHVKNVRALAREAGRDIDVYTVGVVTCRPTAREAEDYW